MKLRTDPAPAVGTFVCVVFLCGCGRPARYGLTVLNRSTNDLAFLHISSDAGDIWFPPIGAGGVPSEERMRMYGAPSPKVTVFPESHILWLRQPARMPSKNVVLSFLALGPTGTVTNRIGMVFSKADQETVRSTQGAFVFTINPDLTITTRVSSGR